MLIGSFVLFNQFSVVNDELYCWYTLQIYTLKVLTIKIKWGLTCTSLKFQQSVMHSVSTALLRDSQQVELNCNFTQ